MRTGRAFNNLIAVIILIAATLLALYSGVGVSYAATTRYSDVLDDLRQDSTFNVADYPAVSNDYSLNVIQVAESVDGELFAYVYQPAAKTKLLVATSVNMSLDEPISKIQVVESSKLYNLTLLNSAGVFQKYRVDGVKVSSEEVRYYNITSIYRAYNRIIDGNSTMDENTNEIAFKVAKLWKVKTDENGKLTYSMTYPEVVTVTDTYNSFIRYRSGYWFVWGDATDGHYVAFTADYDIERLFEAEVYFVQNSITHHYAAMTDKHSYRRGSNTEKQIVLSDIDKGHVTITGLGGTQHSWERIQRVDDFIKSESSLPSDSKNKIKDKQWVLRFTETPYSKVVYTGASLGNYDEEYYEVTNVTILRLYFESNGKVYNLGAVSNKVSEHDPYKKSDETKGKLDILTLIITLIPVIVALLGFLSAIFPSFRSGLVKVFKGLGWLISRPFVGIAALIRKRQTAPAKAPKVKSLKPRTSRAWRRNTGKTKSRTSRTSHRTGSKSK